MPDSRNDHGPRAETAAIPTPSSAPRPGPTLYGGLFLLTLATLLLQLGLTRLFSVIMYYHMAFFAISVTLFGMAFGAVLIHFMPRVFRAERAQLWMTRLSLGFALTTVAAVAVLLAIRFNIDNNKVVAVQLMLISVVLAVPFTFSGMAVALALTRFPRRANWLYGVDLAGAARGCLLFAPLSGGLGGVGYMLAVALLIGVAGLVLALGGGAAGRRRRIGLALVACLGLATLLAGHGNYETFRIRHLRGWTFPTDFLSFDKWNSISRVIAYPAFGGGEQVAPQFIDQVSSEVQMILIDTLAGTPIIKFDGESFADMFYPFHDICYAAHALRPNSRVAVIGSGGGRDVLAAKAWGQPEVLGIDINSRVVEAATRTFGDFAGNPLDWPGVSIVVDEARSRIARSDRPFDIIQASLIDTWAATAAGAFVLTENSLYTTDGWRMFFDRLTKDGLLTMARWYTPGNPVESVRLLALARASLEELGVADFRAHILMARTPQPANPNAQPTAVIVVKKSPLTTAEIDTFEQWAERNHFSLLVTPRELPDEHLSGVMLAPDLLEYCNRYPYVITPPTDDRPFFFSILRWGDIFDREARQGSEYIYTMNLKPLVMLGSLMFAVVLMALAFIIVPLWIQGRLVRRSGAAQPPLGRRLTMALYFIMLGLGYILIELTLMQRFTIFLGHPGYSLTVCLFTMLLASGLGSMVAPRLWGGRSRVAGPAQLLGLGVTIAILLVATLAAALWVMDAFVSSPNALRIALAGLLIAPVAFFMGMPFPLALQSAARDPEAPLAWYWGLNGAFSVCASVLAVALAHTVGLVGAFYVGALCYLIAGLAGLAFNVKARAEVRSAPAAVDFAKN